MVKHRLHLPGVLLRLYGRHGSIWVTMRSVEDTADAGKISPPVSAVSGSDGQQVWDTAREALTGRQYEALEMKHKHGMSYRQIALKLDITRQAVVDRVKSAERKLAVVFSAS